MEVQLQQLIDRIKTEGFAEAEKSAAQVLHNAEVKAAGIIVQAREEAQGIIEQAKKDAARLETNGKQALTLASRDLVLSIRSAIMQLFSALIRREVKSVLNADTLRQLIITLIKANAEKGDSDITVLLSKADLDALIEYFTTKFAAEIRKGQKINLDVRAGSGIEGGFLVSEKNGAAFIDLTDKSIAEMLSVFLNPVLRSFLDGAQDTGSKL